MKPNLRGIPVGSGRVLQATPVFDTYWRFAWARQAVFLKRVQGEPPPWTDDPVLGVHRFTNVYRASDRVSQYLIRNVLYGGDQSNDEVFFRCLLFKIFNRIDTWTHLEGNLGELRWKTYRFDHYADALDNIMSSGSSVYSCAYIMPSPQFGNQRKHRNHLRLLEQMMKSGLPQRIADARSLEAVYRLLLDCPSLGPFLAFQFAIDLNYSTLIDFSEMDYVVAGPGARDGIKKCFADVAGLSFEDVIRVVTERAPEEFARLGLNFGDLWGRKLHLIDCQNIFCEVDKYARVMHPEYSGASGRTRIKQKFDPKARPVPQWYPPKWNLSLPTLKVANSTSRQPTQLQLIRSTHSIASWG